MDDKQIKELIAEATRKSPRNDKEVKEIIAEAAMKLVRQKLHALAVV